MKFRFFASILLLPYQRATGGLPNRWWKGDQYSNHAASFSNLPPALSTEEDDRTVDYLAHFDPIDVQPPEVKDSQTRLQFFPITTGYYNMVLDGGLNFKFRITPYKRCNSRLLVAEAMKKLKLYGKMEFFSNTDQTTLRVDQSTAVNFLSYYNQMTTKFYKQTIISREDTHKVLSRVCTKCNKVGPRNSMIAAYVSGVRPLFDMVPIQSQKYGHSRAAKVFRLYIFCVDIINSVFLDNGKSLEDQRAEARDSFYNLTMKIIENKGNSNPEIPGNLFDKTKQHIESNTYSDQIGRFSKPVIWAGILHWKPELASSLGSEMPDFLRDMLCTLDVIN